MTIAGTAPPTMPKAASPAPAAPVTTATGQGPPPPPPRGRRHGDHDDRPAPAHDERQQRGEEVAHRPAARRRRARTRPSGCGRLVASGCRCGRSASASGRRAGRRHATRRRAQPSSTMSQPGGSSRCRPRRVRSPARPRPVERCAAALDPCDDRLALGADAIGERRGRTCRAATSRSTSSASFQRHVRSGSATTSSSRSVATMPAARAAERPLQVHVPAEVLAVRQPAHPDRMPRARAPGSTATTRPRRGRRAPSRAAPAARRRARPGTGGSVRSGGVAGTLRTVPWGIHSSMRPGSSATTTSGRAAHSRPNHTSWWTIVVPGAHGQSRPA